MDDALQPVYEAIEARTLPGTFDAMFGKAWDHERQRFHMQETYIVDFKENYRENYTSPYGIGLIRCAIALYDTYGGVIVFGVKDRVLNPVGVPGPFEIEFFNRALSDFTGVQIECLTKLYLVPGLAVEICAVLVPKRPAARPATLLQQLGKYSEGTLWVRDRHEVLEAAPRHFPLLYSARSNRPPETPEPIVSVHRSVPPSPATIKDFVGRVYLLKKLWDWMFFSDQPRLYLNGPGGSGKTTLAFEFARLLVESDAEFRFGDDEVLDYVIFISGKETELNPLTGEQQRFLLRTFSNAEEQLRQILYHSCMLDAEQIDKVTDDEAHRLLNDLFNTFSGLIVIDDIDALSRAKKDTGEEALFLKAATSSKRTKILYTLRFSPTYALNSSLTVAGLDEANEFIPFIEACCKQFGVAIPTGDQIHHLYVTTNGLPLIVETIIGLRKFVGTYTDAINAYKDKGGDEARRYLYQREYNRLDPDGRSRYVLAGLSELDQPASFTTISSLFGYTAEQVRDALTECSGIFLSTIDVQEGSETLFQLTPPSVPFIRYVSPNLTFFPKLRRTVELFKIQGSRSTPAENAVIVRMERLFRQNRFQDVVDIEREFAKSDPVLANPKIRSLLGSAYCRLGPQHRESARENFKAAVSVGFHDVSMMRRWYHLELTSGYGMSEAERICRIMLDDPNSAARYRCEFWSKLGNCYLMSGASTMYTDREKTIQHLRQSVLCCLEALRIGADVSDIDLNETIDWLEKPVSRFFKSETTS